MKKKRRVKIVRRKEPTLEDVNLALLSLFAMVDAVFTEDDALSSSKRRMTLGRIYEEWKRCRAVLDPEFDPKEHVRPPRYGTVRVGLSKRGSSPDA